MVEGGRLISPVLRVFIAIGRDIKSAFVEIGFEYCLQRKRVRLLECSRYVAGLFEEILVQQNLLKNIFVQQNI